MFVYEGRKYLIKAGASACYDSQPPWYVKLPNGRVLEIGGWLETMPPQPTEISDPNFLPGFEPEGVFDCEEVR